MFSLHCSADRRAQPTSFIRLPTALLRHLLLLRRHPRWSQRRQLRRSPRIAASSSTSNIVSARALLIYSQKRRFRFGYGFGAGRGHHTACDARREDERPPRVQLFSPEPSHRSCIPVSRRTSLSAPRPSRLVRRTVAPPINRLNPSPEPPAATPISTGLRRTSPSRAPTVRELCRVAPRY